MNNAATRCLFSTSASSADRGFSSDNPFDRLLVGHRHHVGIGIHHPIHNLRIGAKVGSGNVPLGADVGAQCVSKATCYVLEVGFAIFCWVKLDATLTATERKILKRAFPRHPCCKRLAFVEVDIVMVADPAFEGSKNVVVLNAVPFEQMCLSVR